MQNNKMHKKYYFRYKKWKYVKVNRKKLRINVK